MELLQVLDHCPYCGELRERLACVDCGVEAEVINCGHYAQPQPVAASKHDGDPVCDECETRRDAAHGEG